MNLTWEERRRWMTGTTIDQVFVYVHRAHVARAKITRLRERGITHEALVKALVKKNDRCYMKAYNFMLPLARRKLFVKKFGPSVKLFSSFRGEIISSDIFVGLE